MQHRQLSAHEAIWYDPQWLADPALPVFDPAYWHQQQRVLGQASGRGTTWFIRREGGDAALRHYRRGGLFGKLVRDCYWFSGWDNTRSQQEFALLQRLRAAGVNVPKPLAARAVKRGLCYRADLITAKIPAARDLADLLQQGPLDAEEYHCIGAEIARLHRAQVNHTDLNIHNILLDTSGRAWLIDFDKCYAQSGDGWQQSNLDRLRRSFRKEVKKRAIHWQEQDFAALLAGYNASLKPQGL